MVIHTIADEALYRRTFKLHGLESEACARSNKTRRTRWCSRASAPRRED